MNTLLIRALSALVFAVLMVGLSSFEWGYIVLFTLLTAFCTNEFLDISKKLRDENHNFDLFFKCWMMFTNAISFALTASFMSGQLHAKYFSLVPVLLFIALIVELYSKSKKTLVNISIYMFSFVYLGVPFMMLNFIVYKNGYYYPGIILGVFILIWTYDSMAYLIGSRIGKTKLFERISPNKTIEGIIGGVISILTASVIVGFLIPSLTHLQWIIIAIIIAYFAASGDLFESLIKRSLNIKDSGNILPGHGGFLDRFDAFLFTIPFIAFYIICFT